MKSNSRKRKKAGRLGNPESFALPAHPLTSTQPVFMPQSLPQHMAHQLVPHGGGVTALPQMFVQPPAPTLHHNTAGMIHAPSASAALGSAGGDDDEDEEEADECDEDGKASSDDGRKGGRKKLLRRSSEEQALSTTCFAVGAKRPLPKERAPSYEKRLHTCDARVLPFWFKVSPISGSQCQPLRCYCRLVVPIFAVVPDASHTNVNGNSASRIS